MKKLILVTAVAILSGALAVISCKKSDSNSNSNSSSYQCSSCITTAEAKPANDAISKGVYKGVVIGSSGTIKFDIMNGDSTIKAYMVVDGVSVTLTASVAWASGSSYVSPFTGTMNSQPVSITFSVDANGGNPTVTSMSIPGHPNATLTIAKETSDNLIRCFEGVATKNGSTDSSTFDLMLSTSLKSWKAQVRDHGATSSSTVSGTFDGTKLSFDDGKNTSGSATLSGDVISGGTWKNDKAETGTWSAKRTL